MKSLLITLREASCTPIKHTDELIKNQPVSTWTGFVFFETLYRCLNKYIYEWQRVVGDAAVLLLLFLFAFI